MKEKQLRSPKSSSVIIENPFGVKDNLIGEGFMKRLGSTTLDILVTLAACHFTYDPLIRSNIHVAAFVMGIPREVVERNFNNAVRFMFNREVFQRRGERFLERTGRTKWDRKSPKQDEDEIKNISDAMLVLQERPSPELRLAEQDFHQLLSHSGPIESQDRQVVAVQQLAEETSKRTQALAVVTRTALAQPERKKIGSEKKRALIAKQVGSIIGDHSPYLTGQLPFLDQELRILLQFLNWFGTMEGSYEVLEEAARASYHVVNYWLEEAIKNRRQDPSVVWTAIKENEALLASKVLVAVTRRAIPNAKSTAHHGIEELEGNLRTRLQTLDNLEGVKLIRQPNIARLYSILKLASDYKTLPKNLWEIIDGESFLSTPPLEFEFSDGLIVRAVLPSPSQAYLEKQLDNVACWLALRFPQSRRLIISQTSAQGVYDLFSMGTDEFYQRRLLDHESFDYKPTTREAIQDIRTRVETAFGGKDSAKARQNLRRFSEQLRVRAGTNEVSPFFNGFFEITRRKLISRVFQSFDPSLVREAMTMALTTQWENITHFETRALESNPRLKVLVNDRYFRALLALQQMESIISAPENKRDRLENVHKLNELTGLVLGPSFEVLYDPEEQKLLMAA